MRRPLLMVCLCLVVLTALFYYAGGPPLDDLPGGGTVLITGRICQREDDSFYLKIQSIAAASRQENPNTSQIEHSIHRKLICEYENAGEVRLGAVVALRGDFAPFSPATNPGEFDYARYYHSLGIAGRIKNVDILSAGEDFSVVLELLHRLRCYWQGRLYRIFPEKEASVMSAILLGDKSNLDSGIKELYRNNGMIHILSISGLHITVIGMGLYKLLRRLGLPVWLAALLGGTILVLYGIMTGLSVSACRAIGMYLLRMLAQLCGRTYDMLTALGVMAVVLVWQNPGYLEYMGFWLSFGSVLGVGVLCPTLTPAREERKRRAERYVEGRGRRLAKAVEEKMSDAAGQGLLAGISITLTTLPLQLWFTYEVPIYSVFLNVLVIPFMSAVMAFGLAAMLVPGFGFLGTVDVLILSGYEGLCVLFDRLPFHTWNPGRPRLWQVVLYYVLWLAVVWGTDAYRQMRKKGKDKSAGSKCSDGYGQVREKGKGKSARLKCSDVYRQVREKGKNSGRADIQGRGGLASVLREPGAVMAGKAVVLAAAVLVLGVPTAKGDRVTFLDVGQGDCICVQFSTGEVYLFDCGSSSRSRIGERVLIPFLKYYGIRHVDGIFLSHPDADHENGILELLALGGKEHITVGQVILPGIAETAREEQFGELLKAVKTAAQKKPVAVGYVKAGDNLWDAGEDKAEFLCLHPAADFPAGNANAYSECFYLELGNGFSLLLTGDVEGEGEEALLGELRRRGIGEVTVLKTAHHGSKYSTSEELLEQASPALAVISCGRRNRYGHPHAETLERLKETGAVVLRTDESGAITMEFRKKQAVVEVFGG